ncbi:MAG: ABC transporter ATP-binding protein [Proteobacteria bacterium]|nr:ABC transporter ATP-binding protein [Pseudomonadota bacterium]
MTSELAISISDLEYSYTPTRPIINIKALSVRSGERVFIYGPSGSGKTTLLGIVGGILQPQKGSVSVLGTDFAALKPGQRDLFRGRHLGFIFQMFNLIPFLTVEENILLSFNMGISKRSQNLSKSALIDEAKSLCQRLGIDVKFSDQVMSLSVGQQQRVAAARALIAKPKILIADEPTSALDSHHRRAFLDLLFEECRSIESTLLFVSHDLNLKDQFSRVIDLTTLNEAAKERQGGGDVSY